MAKRRSARQWASILQSYRGSGLTQAEFCRRKGLALATLGYHLRGERSPDGEQMGSEAHPAPRLLEVTPAPDSSRGSALAPDRVLIEIDAACGQTVRIYCHCQKTGEVLRQVSGLPLA